MRIYCHIIAIVCFVASAQSLEKTEEREEDSKMQARRRPDGGSDGKKREG